MSGHYRLSPKGRQLRETLAQEGLELTPEQLTTALLEAKARLAVEFPDGVAPKAIYARILADSIAHQSTGGGVPCS